MVTILFIFLFTLRLPSLFCSPFPKSVPLADVFCIGLSLFLCFYFAETDIPFLGELKKKLCEKETSNTCQFQLTFLEYR